MKKGNIVLIIVAILVLLALVIGATYAFFSSNVTISNAANVNVITEGNNMVFDTLGGAMTLNVTATNMSQAASSNIAAQNNTTLTVNFQANTDYSMVCSYDIVYEWTSTDKYQAHSSGVTEWEYTIKASLASNAHVYEGDNLIKVEQDLSAIVGNQNSATVVSGATIDGTGTSTSTAIWTLTSKFYNVNANQSGLSDKVYTGNFKVTNVSCTGGTVEKKSYWFSTSCRLMQPCIYPNYGGTLQTSGSATGHQVYIAQDNTKYYACATIDGHEVCLSQPFTQYGLQGHTTERFTSNERANAIRAIYQVFIDAGINIDMSNCSSNTSIVICDYNDFSLGVSYLGQLRCEEGGTPYICGIERNRNDGAFCWNTNEDPYAL